MVGIVLGRRRHYAPPAPSSTMSRGSRRTTHPLPSFCVYVERDKSLRRPGPNDVMFSALLSLAFCGQAWGVTSPCLPRFRNFSGLFVLFLYTLDTDVLLLLSRSCEVPDSIDKAQPLPPLLLAFSPPSQAQPFHLDIQATTKPLPNLSLA